MNCAFGAETFAVDTHVFRVSQPHRPGAGQGRARGRAQARQGRRRRLPPRRPSSADPARPLCLQGARSPNAGAASSPTSAATGPRPRRRAAKRTLARWWREGEGGMSRTSWRYRPGTVAHRLRRADPARRERPAGAGGSAARRRAGRLRPYRAGSGAPASATTGRSTSTLPAARSTATPCRTNARGSHFEDGFSYRTSLGQLCSTDMITVTRRAADWQGPTCGLGRFQPIETGGSGRGAGGLAGPLLSAARRGQAPVAQLDRALPSEGRGHRFESCRVRQRCGTRHAIAHRARALRGVLP